MKKLERKRWGKRGEENDFEKVRWRKRESHLEEWFGGLARVKIES